MVAACLACIEEEAPSAARPDGKYRTIFDDTAPHVNNKIRVQDQLEMPGAPELERIVSWSRRRSRRGRTRAPFHVFLKFDVKGAHRLIKHPQKDWKYLACHIADKWYANKVGTFGSSAAPYQWGRLYSGVHRLHGHLAAKEAWGLIFSGDGIWALPLSMPMD